MNVIRIKKLLIAAILVGAVLMGCTSKEPDQKAKNEVYVNSSDSLHIEEFTRNVGGLLVLRDDGVTSLPSAPPKKTNEFRKDIKVISKISELKTKKRTVSSMSSCNIGVNTGDLNYYSSEMPIKDLSKMSGGWDADVALDKDSSGYLKTLKEGVVARTIITDGLWGRSEDDNKYVLLYEGEGELSFWLVNPKVLKKSLGRIEFEIPKGRWGLLQKSTNPNNYLRNIRVLPLAEEGKEIIRKRYKEKWVGAGVLRFLDAQVINNSKEKNWGDRQNVNTFGAPKGQSIEDVIQMANEMNVNPWLMVPHLATDDYFRQMAVYVRDNLDEHLKVYIEYTNEAWNFGFQQATYLYKLSQKKGTAREVEYGMRSKQLFDIWGAVFGGNKRLVRVISTQLYNPWLTEQIMKTPGLSGSFDALAVGYYIGHEFSGKKAEELKTMTNDQIFDYLRDVSFPEVKQHLMAQKNIAKKHNVPLIAYEAGQHLVSNVKSRENLTVVAKFNELQKSPRMYSFYLDMYKQWNDAGGELLVWFKTSYRSSKWGGWGLLENISASDKESPKFMAYKKILRESGC